MPVRTISIVFGLCAILATSLIYYFCADADKFADQDVYSRLNLVERFAQTGDWYDNTLPRDNPQRPETTQWSRLLDVVILGGGWLLGNFIGLKAGIWWWAALVSPIFFGLGCVVIAWAGKPLLSEAERAFSSFLYLCQPTIITYSMFGRPDHHGLLILLMTLSMALMVKLLTEEQVRPGTALFAALAQSLALAISVEALVSVALSYLALGIGWLRHAPGAERKAAWYAAGIAGWSLWLYGIHVPLTRWNWLELDRVSLVHLALFVLVTVFWLGVSWLAPRRKFVVSVCGGLLILLAVEWLNPKFIFGPTAYIDPFLKQIWFSHISEYTRLYEPLRNFPSLLILLLFPALLGTPWCVYKIRHSSGLVREAWIYLSLLGAAFFVLTVFQSRWALYAQAVAVIPFANLVFTTLTATLRLCRPRFHLLARCLVLLFFCCGSLLIGGLITPKNSLPQAPKAAVSIRELCAWIDQQPFARNPLTLAASYNYGAEIVYRTPLTVIATGSHRNADGILYIYKLFNDDNLSQIRAELSSKQIDLILITYSVPDAPVDTKNKKSFYHLLHDNQLPPWIKPIPLPEKLSQSYRLFRFSG